jgi:hypothetical protein
MTRAFSDWMRERVAEKARISALPDGLFEKNGKIRAKCCVCGKSYEFTGDPATFDKENSYCGKPPLCRKP